MTKTLVGRYLRKRPAVMAMLTGWFFLPVLASESTAALVALMFGMALFSWAVVPSAVSAFTCALPIRGRELVMARVLAMIGVTAIPVVVWATTELVTGSIPTILQPGLRPATLALALGAAGAVAWVHYGVADALPIPLHRMAAWKEEPERAKGVGRDTAWWSVVRTALPPAYLLYCAVLLGAAAVGFATPVYCVVLLFLPAMIRQRSEWLTALPVSPRQRLRLIVLPTVVVFVACIELGRVLHLLGLGRGEQLSGDWRVWLIEAAVLMVLGAGVVLLIDVGDVLSRGRRGVVGELLGELTIVPVAAVVVADILPRVRGTEGIAALTTRTLHDTAASSAVHAWSLFVLAVVLLVTVYALLELQFRRSGTAGGAGAQAA